MSNPKGIDMKITFQKMHGAKNDFIIFHDMENAVLLSPSQVSIFVTGVLVSALMV